MPSDLLPVTLDEMIAEVQRELDMRDRLYPEWKRGAGIIARKRLERRMLVMEAVLDKLRAERDAPY